MTEIVMYSTATCPFCIRAKRVFDLRGLEYQDIDVGRDPSLRQVMMEKSGARTVPQIWINDQHIGGCQELLALESSGKLDSMLS